MSEDEQGDHSPPTLITAPRGGSVSLITDNDGLARLIDGIDPGAPVAIDAERAQSFRYSPRAYLVQLRQSACGTHMLDPIALAGDAPMADLRKLGDALAGCEWVLHAASQDLPCLAEMGMKPHRLFDTELAGRLLDLPKVSISPMLTQFLGIELAKAHSADDWSRRPLPEDSLDYAALDVDYLLELRDAVALALDEAGKAEWARQEFDDVMSRFAITPSQDEERWRHTKGLGHLHQPREFAVARSLWQQRDDIARRLDIFPGRILSDAQLTNAATVLAALKQGQVASTLPTIDGFGGRFARRHISLWTNAVEDALKLKPSLLPRTIHGHEVPPPRFWQQMNPAASQRWELARPVVLAVALQHQVPPENLMTVSTLATLIWQSDADFSEAGLRAVMMAHQVRPWQQDLLAPALAEVLSAPRTGRR